MRKCSAPIGMRKCSKNRYLKLQQKRDSLRPGERLLTRLNWGRGDEGDLNIPRIPHGHRVVPPDMTEETWNKWVESFNSEEYRIAPPRINETSIADEVLGIRKGYRRGAGPKLMGATSTSTTASSPPHQPPYVPDLALQDFFSETQNYLAVANQCEQVLLA
ncbi:hypothetical protein TorRG33x02_177510 [Trema orientale]|uniref:Uncharacterized protein n=1 Tax=Trema orientale TaxID=63057 RepID=A0A2P5ELJ4_TREOI|nr:hypothetical protein TorRG33x02_177510 [Trema orientale]